MHFRKLFFPEKKKKGPKFAELHCYDNLRNSSAYFISPPPSTLPLPGQQHLHQLPHPLQQSFAHQTNSQHQQQHRGQQPQLCTQSQVISQSQIITQATQCQCQQCSYQQQQQHQTIQAPITGPIFGNCISTNGNQPINQHLSHVQQLAPQQHIQQQNHYQQPHISHHLPQMLPQQPIPPQPQQIQACIQPQQLLPSSQQMQHPQHPQQPHQPPSHQQQPHTQQSHQPQSHQQQSHQPQPQQQPHLQQVHQQQNQSCAFPSSPPQQQQQQHYIPQNSAPSQVAPSSNQVQPQCTCQHCPYQQQHPNPIQHHTNNHIQQQLSSQPQQTLLTTGPQMQNNSMAQSTNGNSQIYSNSYYNIAPANQQHSIHQQQYHTIGHQTQTYSSMINPNNSLQSAPPVALRSMTPGLQQHQTAPRQTYECHTIQPQLYQQQKQQYQQQALPQIHQRVQSLHQQQQIIPMVQGQQFNQAKSLHELHSDPEAQLEPDGNSRYANLGSRQSPENYTRYSNLDIKPDPDDYQEHVYCNQSKKLPPYQSPPSYNRFMALRKEYEFERNRQHMTHLSESSVWTRAKDSSYENLRSHPYGNLGSFRKEIGKASH